MALTDPYGTVDGYKVATGTTDAGNDDAINRDLVMVSRHLEKILSRRTFHKDTADTSRIYTVDRNSFYLDIDDLSAAPTSVIVDVAGDALFTGSPLAATEYVLYPRNAAADGEPYTQIARKGTYWTRDQEIRVTGRFGWSAVPPAIVGACYQLTAIWRLETPRATSRIPELGEAIEASQEAQNIVRSVVNQYRKRYWFA